MEVTYRKKKLQRICTDFNEAKKKYGFDGALKIHRRINELSAATSVEELIKNHIGRCHHLEGSRKGQYAMDLEHPYRLVFTISEFLKIEIVEVIEIVDYHK